MRRNLKLIIVVSITWMFFMVYYFQSTTDTKVKMTWNYVILKRGLNIVPQLLVVVSYAKGEVYC